MVDIWRKVSIVEVIIIATHFIREHRMNRTSKDTP